MSDPLEPIKKVGEQLQKVAKDIGLDLQQFVIVPDMTGGTAHIAQAVFVYDGSEVLASLAPDAAASPLPDQDDIDRQFQEILHGATKADEDSKVQEARDTFLQLQERLKGGGPILGGDES